MVCLHFEGQNEKTSLCAIPHPHVPDSNFPKLARQSRAGNFNSYFLYTRCHYILRVIKLKWTFIYWEFSFERLFLPYVLLKSFGISGGKKACYVQAFLVCKVRNTNVGYWYCCIWLGWADTDTGQGRTTYRRFCTGDCPGGENIHGNFVCLTNISLDIVIQRWSSYSAVTEEYCPANWSWAGI